MSPSKSLRIGVIYNLKRIAPDLSGHNDHEAEFDSEKTVRAICDAISAEGHCVFKLEATPDLPRHLIETPIDIAFNIAEGINGRSRESQVPALLDMLGIEHTASDATTMAITLDKSIAKCIIKEAGIHTAKFMLMHTGHEPLSPHFQFPLFLKPNTEGSSKGVFEDNVVLDEATLRKKALQFIDRYKQSILVEEYVHGREFTVGILCNDTPRVLAPMEIVFTDKSTPHPVYTFKHKLNFNDEVRYDTPALLSPEERHRIENVCLKIFRALSCRDVARIDIRMKHNGDIYFIECNPIPGLSPDWSDICLIAKSEGLTYTDLIREILTPAIKRFHRK